jgi:hypothetical protein
MMTPPLMTTYDLRLWWMAGLALMDAFTTPLPFFMTVTLFDVVSFSAFLCWYVFLVQEWPSHHTHFQGFEKKNKENEVASIICSSRCNDELENLCPTKLNIWFYCLVGVFLDAFHPIYPACDGGGCIYSGAVSPLDPMVIVCSWFPMGYKQWSVFPITGFGQEG